MALVNLIDFCDLFTFAEDDFGVTWNEACDMFHSSELIEYKSVTDVTNMDLDCDEYVKAMEIINAWIEYLKASKSIDPRYPIMVDSR